MIEKNDFDAFLTQIVFCLGGIGVFFVFMFFMMARTIKTNLSRKASRTIIFVIFSIKLKTLIMN